MLDGPVHLDARWLPNDLSQSPNQVSGYFATQSFAKWPNILAKLATARQHPMMSGVPRSPPDGDHGHAGRSGQRAAGSGQPTWKPQKSACEDPSGIDLGGLLRDFTARGGEAGCAAAGTITLGNRQADAGTAGHELMPFPVAGVEVGTHLFTQFGYMETKIPLSIGRM